MEIYTRLDNSRKILIYIGYIPQSDEEDDDGNIFQREIRPLNFSLYEERKNGMCKYATRIWELTIQ